MWEPAGTCGRGERRAEADTPAAGEMMANWVQTDVVIDDSVKVLDRRRPAAGAFNARRRLRRGPAWTAPGPRPDAGDVHGVCRGSSQVRGLPGAGRRHGRLGARPVPVAAAALAAADLQPNAVPCRNLRRRQGGEPRTACEAAADLDETAHRRPLPGPPDRPTLRHARRTTTTMWMCSR